MNKNELESYLRSRILLEININELKQELNEEQMGSLVHHLAQKSELLNEGFFSSVASMLGFDGPGEVKRFLAGRTVSYLGVPKGHPLYSPLTNFINKLSVREITGLYNGNPRIRKKLVKVLTNATVAAFRREMPSIMGLTGGSLGDPITDAMIDAVSKREFKLSVQRSLEEALIDLPDSSAADIEEMRREYDERISRIERGIEDISSSLRDRADSDPTVADTDGDGASDGVEREVGTDPRDSDTDDDGLSDGEEIGDDVIDAAEDSGTTGGEEVEPMKSRIAPTTGETDPDVPDTQAIAGAPEGEAVPDDTVGQDSEEPASEPEATTEPEVLDTKQKVQKMKEFVKTLTGGKLGVAPSSGKRGISWVSRKTNAKYIDPIYAEFAKATTDEEKIQALRTGDDPYLTDAGLAYIEGLKKDPEDALDDAQSAGQGGDQAAAAGAATAAAEGGAEGAVEAAEEAVEAAIEDPTVEASDAETTPEEVINLDQQNVVDGDSKDSETEEQVPAATPTVEDPVKTSAQPSGSTKDINQISPRAAGSTSSTELKNKVLDVLKKAGSNGAGIRDISRVTDINAAVVLSILEQPDLDVERYGKKYRLKDLPPEVEEPEVAEEPQELDAEPGISETYNKIVDGSLTLDEFMDKFYTLSKQKGKRKKQYSFDEEKFEKEMFSLDPQEYETSRVYVETLYGLQKLLNSYGLSQFPIETRKEAENESERAKDSMISKIEELLNDATDVLNKSVGEKKPSVTNITIDKAKNSIRLFLDNKKTILLSDIDLSSVDKPSFESVGDYTGGFSSGSSVEGIDKKASKPFFGKNIPLPAEVRKEVLEFVSSLQIPDSVKDRVDMSGDKLETFIFDFVDLTTASVLELQNALASIKKNNPNSPYIKEIEDELESRKKPADGGEENEIEFDAPEGREQNEDINKFFEFRSRSPNLAKIDQDAQAIRLHDMKYQDVKDELDEMETNLAKKPGERGAVKPDQIENVKKGIKNRKEQLKELEKTRPDAVALEERALEYKGKLDTIADDLEAGKIDLKTAKRKAGRVDAEYRGVAKPTAAKKPVAPPTPEEMAAADAEDEALDPTEDPGQDDTPVSDDIPAVKPKPKPTRGKKLSKEEAQNLISQTKESLLEKYEDNNQTFIDTIAREFEAELGVERSGVYNDQGKVKGTGERSAFTKEKLEQILKVAEKEAIDKAFRDEEESEQSNVYGGAIQSIDLVSEDGEIYLRTTPNRKGKFTKFPIDQEGKIATAARKALEMGKENSESDLLKALNAVGGGLKNAVVDAVKAEYDRQSAEGILPTESRKIVNLSSFNITDVSGLFPEEFNITQDQRNMFARMKSLYDSQGNRIRMNRTAMQNMAKLAAEASISMNGKDLDAIFAELEEIYGDPAVNEERDINLEEIFSISEDELRRLLA